VSPVHRSLEGEALAGGDAAAQPESEQTALWGKDVLVRENERWDWMLGKWVLFHPFYGPVHPHAPSRI
jgi:hypothetical protein